MNKSFLMERLKEVEANLMQSFSHYKMIEGMRDEILFLLKKMEDLEKEPKPV